MLVTLSGLNNINPDLHKKAEEHFNNIKGSLTKWFKEHPVELTREEIQKVRAENITQRGADAILEEVDTVSDRIDTVEEKVTSDIQGVESVAQKALSVAEETKKTEVAGIQGDKGDTPTDKELLALIKPLIPTPEKGYERH